MYLIDFKQDSTALMKFQPKHFASHWKSADNNIFLLQEEIEQVLDPKVRIIFFEEVSDNKDCNVLVQKNME